MFVVQAEHGQGALQEERISSIVCNENYYTNALLLPLGGVRLFHQNTTCIMQLTLWRYVVQIWSRNTPKTSPVSKLWNSAEWNGQIVQ